MSEVQLIKTPGGMLRPANQADNDELEKIRNSALVHAEIKQPRNPQFHRKFFAMLNFAYDYWEAPEGEYKGQQAEKNFDRFRKDLMILAGFYTVVTNIRGEVKAEPKSISFSSMDETEFHDVYRRVFDVAYRLVLSKVQGMTEEAAENAINNMLSYD